ncbi:DUF5825 family protein [Kitasatospora sp. NPDC092286]|uniref:DUF5825 family protein n=1 Tax=Kitasatospora sp. NPDC092286 TaxID=3364087 RepID=UPI003814EED3
MPSQLAEPPSPAITVEAWRDHDPAARTLPGMALGRLELADAARPDAERLYRAGARHVRLPHPVDLCAATAGPESARALLLLRELTGRGLAVDWVARCADGCAADGALGHLYPPSRIEGAPPQAAGAWRAGYFPARCVYRHGPGFIEVRDRRFGPLDLFTIDEPHFLTAVAGLLEGSPTGTVPDDVRAELADARLIAEHAGRLWWLPTRPYRWPLGSLGL